MNDKVSLLVPFSLWFPAPVTLIFRLQLISNSLRLSKPAKKGVHGVAGELAIEISREKARRCSLHIYHASMVRFSIPSGALVVGWQAELDITCRCGSNAHMFSSGSNVLYKEPKCRCL